jgi:hypothetical protein
VGKKKRSKAQKMPTYKMPHDEKMRCRIICKHPKLSKEERILFIKNYAPPLDQYRLDTILELLSDNCNIEVYLQRELRKAYGFKFDQFKEKETPEKYVQRRIYEESISHESVKTHTT